MKTQLFAWILLVAPMIAHAAPPGVLRLDPSAPMAETYRAVSTALEKARFWVVFEADLHASMAGFAERWGDDLNRNALLAAVAAAEGR